MSDDIIRWFPSLASLYAAKSPVDPGRPIFQGDVFNNVVCNRYPDQPAAEVAPRGRRGYAMVLGHPCEVSELEKGGDRLWRTVCPVACDRENRLRLDGEGDFYAFPLPDLLDDGALWYADFRFFSTCHRDYLDVSRRVAALSVDGWHALQRRMIHFFTRIIVHPDDLAAAGEGLHPDARGTGSLPP